MHRPRGDIRTACRPASRAMSVTTALVSCIANTTGYYGEGATFLLLAAAACTALAAVRHPRRHGEG